MTFDADSTARLRAANELETTFLVEAGAGTGKTTLLIDRILSILREKRADVKEIVAITFTEKAAGELLAKLRARLERERGKGNFAERALSELDRARVSTIHSFAGSLLRERPVEAAVDPWFEVADDIDAKLILDDAWELWFGRRGREGSSALTNALRLGMEYQIIKQLAFHLYGWRDLFCEVHYAEPPPIPEGAVRRAIGDMKPAVCAAEKGLSAPSDSCLDNARRLLADLEGLDFSDRRGFLSRFFALQLSAKKGSRKNYADPGILEKLKAVLENITGDLAAHRRRAAYGVLRDLLLELGTFFEFVGAAKEKEEKLDFQDLLLLARNLLRGNREVREYFQQQFKYILVDEFQDTDPLQVELVFYLAENGARASDWREVDLVPGKLFIVGDPKQSIYRFRRADIEMYEDAKQLLRKSGEVLPITKNFRTVPQLVSMVNDIFENVIVRSPGKYYQPEYIPILAGRPVPSHRGPALLLLPPTCALEGFDVGGIRAEEARHIAGFLRKAVRGGYEVYDKSLDAMRNLEFRDIVLLFRSFTEIDLYEDAMREHEIPFQLEGRGEFYRTQEVRSLTNILKAVANPEDELSAAAALRSEYFGVSDQDLLEWKASGRRFACMEALRNEPPAPAALAPVREALCLLAELHGKRNAVPVGLLIQELLDRTKALEALFLTRGGERAVANVMKLALVARDLEQRGEPFGRVVGMLDDFGSMGLEEMESPLSEPGENRVSLLTIHRAKGLEYPMVVLGNLGAQGSMSGNRDRFTILPRRAGEHPMLEVRVRSDRMEFMTMRFEEERETDKEMSRAEEKRLLYVAWTRARDYLVLPTFFREHGNCLFSFLQPSLEMIEREAEKGAAARVVGGEELEFAEEEPSPFLIPGLLRRAGGKAVSLGIGKRNAWLEERRLLLERAGQCVEVVSPSSLPPAADEREFVPEKLFSEFLEVEGYRDLPFAERKRIALGYGSAVHKVLEYIDLDTPSELTALSGWAARAAGVESLAAKVERLVTNVLSLDVFARARSGRFFREYPVSAWDDGKLIQGTMDLVIEEADGLTIIDYKTDFVEGDGIGARAEHYRPQIEAYARALEAATGKKVKEASLLFLIPRTLVPLLPPAVH